MTAIAIVMMLVAMLTIWGGLLASVIFLKKNPMVSDAELPDPDALHVG